MRPFSLTIFSILLGFGFLSAQPWMKPSMLTTKRSAVSKPNLKEVEDKFEAYWKGKNPSVDEAENREEGGYQQFRRWQWFAKQRMYPSGNMFDPEILYKESRRYQQSAALFRTNSRTANWEFIGPAVVPASGGGAGRINVIRIQPNNSNVLYVGAACGGVWKSIDAGATWSSSFDFSPAISVADIAINPRNTDTVYAATGDGYGYEVTDGFWGGVYSAGVLMSANGGATWQQTGLTYAQTNSEIIQRIIVKPDQPEILLASTRNSLFRSSDAGATWVSVRPGHHFDIEFHPTRPDTIFATSSSELIWSIDGGSTWSVRQSGLCSGRLSLALTPANANRVFLLCEDGALYRSDDLGATIQTMSSPTNANLYGYYDAVLAVSPTNANYVVCGGMSMVRSIDGGNTWSQIGSSVHADQHYLEYQSGNGQVLYSCNDGGVYKSTTGGSSWTNLSNGICVKQYYRIAQSASDPYTIYVGAQDNGTDQLVNNTWTQVFGGDGMDCLVDYSNDQNVYVSYQYGALQKSTDGGLSFSDIAPSSGAWVSPFAIHPTDPQIIYAGYEDVYKSLDGGLNWSTISSGAFNDDIIALEVARSNPDYVYAATFSQLLMTADDGANWVNVTNGLPVANAVITGVTTSTLDPRKVWVTFSGYSAGEKVFYSDDAGVHWVNFSGSLPNLPVNCIVYQNNSPGSLYVGTDMGVFYRDTTLNDWVSFNNLLPNVIISDLDFQYGSGKLRAATYGRGLWESDLQSYLPPTLDASIVQINHPQGTFCSGPIQPEIVIQNNGADTITAVTIETFVDNFTMGSFVWNGTLYPGQQQVVSLLAFALYPGGHVARIELSLPNGGVDQNPLNDTKSSTFVMLNTPMQVPMSEDFESQQLPPVDWSVLDPAGLYQLNTTVGGFSLSTASVFANCFDIASGTARLITPVFDFSTVQPPAQILFDLAYAQYDLTYHDSLVVTVSTDCGDTFNRIYAKGDDSLATAPMLAAKFLPGSAADWRQEVIDISPFAGYSEVFFRFEVISGYGNDVYLDNININGNNTTAVHGIATTSEKLIVYPNPASSMLNWHRSGFSSRQLTWEIKDVLGRTMLLQTTHDQDGFVDISSLTPGMFLFTARCGEEVIANTRFIKE